MDLDRIKNLSEKEKEELKKNARYVVCPTSIKLRIENHLPDGEKIEIMIRKGDKVTEDKNDGKSTLETKTGNKCFTKKIDVDCKNIDLDPDITDDSKMTLGCVYKKTFESATFNLKFGYNPRAKLTEKPADDEYPDEFLLGKEILVVGSFEADVLRGQAPYNTLVLGIFPKEPEFLNPDEMNLLMKEIKAKKVRPFCDRKSVEEMKELLKKEPLMRIVYGKLLDVFKQFDD